MLLPFCFNWEYWSLFGPKSVQIFYLLVATKGGLTVVDINSVAYCFYYKFLIHIFLNLQQLFDSLCVLLHEERLFLQTVVDNHLSPCTSVKHSAMKILLFIGKYFPNIQKTKVIFVWIYFLWSCWTNLPLYTWISSIWINIVLKP